MHMHYTADVPLPSAFELLPIQDLVDLKPKISLAIVCLGLSFSEEVFLSDSTKYSTGPFGYTKTFEDLGRW